MRIILPQIPHNLSGRSGQIRQNICDIIENKIHFQVSVVRWYRQWSCSASSHNSVVGRSENLERRRFCFHSWQIWNSGCWRGDDCPPLNPSSDGPAQLAKSTRDEHYRLDIILLKVKMSLIPDKNQGGLGRFPPGSDGPAQPAKSIWDEHYRWKIIDVLCVIYFLLPLCWRKIQFNFTRRNIIFGVFPLLIELWTSYYFDRNWSCFTLTNTIDVAMTCLKLL